MVEATNAVFLQIGDQLANVVATPEQALLLAFGALFVLVSVGAFGLLTAGAALEFISGLLPSGGRSRQAR